MCVLQVVREGGSLSLVTLHWAVVNDVDDDIIDTSGELVFRRSQTFADIIIQVNDDSIPELDEVFAVVLINASSVMSIFNIQFINTTAFFLILL